MYQQLFKTYTLGVISMGNVVWGINLKVGEPMRPIIDPSGYVYEAVASNRLQGVTITCYEKVTKYDIYDEAYTEISMWDAEEFAQRNPLTTDALGQYSWDVPTGWCCNTSWD